MKIGIGLAVAKQESKQNTFYPQDAMVVQIEVPAGAVDASKNYYKFLTSQARSYTVDWGDGVDNIEVKTGTETTVAHTYTAAGTYIIQLYDIEASTTKGLNALSWGSGTSYTGSANVVTDIIQWGNWSWTSMNKLFFDCENIGTVSAGDIPNLSATNCLMTSLFENCSTNLVIHPTISHWQTEAVIDMRFMFKSTEAMNGSNPEQVNIGNWDITGLTAAKGCTNMFFGGTSEADWAISTVNYDKLLIGWGAQAESTASGIAFSARSTKYTGGGAAATGRAALVAAGWTITDGGTV